MTGISTLLTIVSVPSALKLAIDLIDHISKPFYILRFQTNYLKQ